MKKNLVLFVSTALLAVLLLACGEKPTAATSVEQTGPSSTSQNAKGPHITLSDKRLPEGGHVLMRGSGFTPLSTALSHLKKPDGSEYNVISFLTNDKGEIEHDIESFLLPIGGMEVWVIDEKTGVSSNVERFETTHDQMPLAK